MADITTAGAEVHRDLVQLGVPLSDKSIGDV